MIGMHSLRTVERIVFEENKIDKIEKLQQKSITEELNEARVELNDDISISNNKKSES